LLLCSVEQEIQRPAAGDEDVETAGREQRLADTQPGGTAAIIAAV